MTLAHYFGCISCAVALQVTYLVTLSTVGDLKARGPQALRDMMGWARPVAGGFR